MSYEFVDQMMEQTRQGQLRSPVSETLDMHRTIISGNPLAERVFAVTSFGMLAPSG